MATPKETPKAPPAALETPAQAEAKRRGKALWATLVATIDAQIAGNRKAGWGQADSLAVIERIVAEDASLSKAGSVQQYTLSDEALLIIGNVVNPSAFRQQLEDPKGLNRLDKVEGKRTGSLKKFQEEFGS